MNAMTDMSQVIIPRSDQINADDLIAGPMTITIRDVQISGGTEQPVSIYFDGSDKAFRPCKSMSRVLVQGWGADAKAYLGRALTLYRDPTVKWGGMEVGGIRISHMSHIDGVKTMILTATKGSRKPHKIMPLVIEAPVATVDAATKFATAYIAKLATFSTLADLQAFAASKASKLNELKGARRDLYDQVGAAVEARISQLGASGFDDDLDDAPHPASATADKILAELEECTTAAQIDTLQKNHADAIFAMPDEMGDTVRGAIDKARARLAVVA